MNTRRARVVALISGVAFAVVALAAPAAAADNNERWLATVYSSELMQRCVGDEPFIFPYQGPELSIWRPGDHKVLDPWGDLGHDDYYYGGDRLFGVAPGESRRLPAGDYVAAQAPGNAYLFVRYAVPFTVRPCPFPGATPPEPTQTVEASISKLSGGRFRVTVDNREVPTSVRIGITWRDSRGRVDSEVFSVARDSRVTTGTWVAKRGTVISVQDRTHKELLASTRR